MSKNTEKSSLKIDWIEIAESKLGIKPNACKVCGGELALISVLNTQRGPPQARPKANLNFEVQ